MFTCESVKYSPPRIKSVCYSGSIGNPVLREHHVWIQQPWNEGYKTGGDVFKQQRHEQLESCGGAKGWREVYGHHIPLWDLWAPDAGCYLLLGWTETYCCELPPPPPPMPPPCAAGAQQPRENPGVCRIKGKVEPKRSCFLSRLSYFWNRGTRFWKAENIPLLFTESLSHFVTRSPV